MHLAPELALSKIFSSLNIEYITADLNPDAADYKVNITKLPFADNSFDIIICYHVLEHVENDKKAMRELYRVLRKGGIAFIQSTVFKDLKRTYEDPNITSPKARLKAFGQDDHVRKYGLDFTSRLTKAGFKVIIDEYAQKLGAGKIRKYALRPYEEIYVCSKEDDGLISDPLL